MVLFSSLGYQEDSLKIELSGKPVYLELKLREKYNELNTVSITAGSFEAGDSKKNVVFSSLDIATTAGSAADVFAALQTLPGTQTSFSESGLFVRGGAASETRTFFDGLLVKSPFNSTVPDQASRGRFSPFLFKGTSFSAGGYSAQYGQALSSALLLESKDLPEKTTTGLSLLSVGAGVDQNIRFKNSALTIGGFYYNLKPAFSLLKQHTNWEKEPEQYGSNVQYKIKTSSTGMFKWYSDFSNSKIGLYTADLDKQGGIRFFSNINKNTYINTSFQDYLSRKWKIQSGLALSNTDDSGLQEDKTYQRTDRVIQGRVSLTNYYASLSSLKFGAETFSTKRYERFDGLSREYTDQLSAAFAETDLFITNRIVARLGLRAEYSSYMNAFNLAPRSSLGYKTGRHSQVSMAFGRFYQNPEDDYLISKPLDFEQADHYLMNFQYNSKEYTFRTEAYFKNYNRLTKTDGTGLNNSGDGYARGVDVFWRDKKSVKGADYWISYSFLDSKRNYRDYPARATPPFAAKHTLNLVYKQFFQKLNSQVATTYTFATGRTYVNPNNPVYLGDKTANLNNVSLNISYLTHIFRQFTVLYLSASNIAGFKNIYGYNYSSNGQFRQAVRPPANRDIFLGILITIGDNTFVR